MNGTTNGAGGMGGFQSPVMNSTGGEQQIIQQDLTRQQVDAVQNAALTLMGQDEGNICDLENILRSRQASDNYAKALNQFQRLRASPLPPRLFDEFNNVRAKCFMGIFPEINRVWVTIDNRLFLWDFIEGSLVCFPEEDKELGTDVFVSIGLVPPKPGVFIEEIKYILVLATPIEIVLLAVTFVGGELRLLPTQIALPSDNVVMMNIVGTSNGRIFMCGEDGFLYELIYEAEDGWFRKRCRKLNRSSSVLGSFVPSIVRQILLSEDPIIDLAVDNSRNVLYTLSELSCIDVYDLGTTGTALTRVKRFKNVVESVRSVCAQGTMDVGRIVSLKVVSPQESQIVHLIAVTSTGMRLYFTTTPSISQRPRGLDLMHVRPLPQGVDFGRQVVASYYEDGTFLVALGVEQTEDEDSLLGCTLDVANLLANRAALSRNIYAQCDLFEHFDTFEAAGIRGKIWAIEEASIGAGHQTNELSAQQSKPPRHFLCLTNGALFTLVKLRPIDTLSQLLSISNGQHTEELRRFFEEIYRPDQACAMCLQLACTRGRINNRLSFDGPTPANPLITNSALATGGEINTTVARWAGQAYFRYGGFAVRSAARRVEANAGALGGYGNESYLGGATQLSGCHDGFCLYLSRILRPIWQQPVIQFTSPSPEHLAQPIDEALVREVQELLLNLKNFINTNPNLAVLVVVGKPGQTMEFQDSQNREQQSWVVIYHLLLQCLEATMFLRVLCKFRVFQVISQAVQNTLSTVQFSELTTGLRNQQITKEIVSSLIAVHGEDNHFVESLVTQLREQCPNFFTDTDELLFGAHRLFTIATKIPTLKERKEALTASAEHFLRVAPALTVDVLDGIKEKYLGIGFYSGIVKLTLRHFTVHSKDPDFNPERYAKIITDVFDQLQKVSDENSDPTQTLELNEAKLESVKAILNSTDTFFHQILCRWFISKKLIRGLFEFVRTSKHLESSDYLPADYLWQYYEFKGQHALAAESLEKLAAEKPDASLDTRIEYLSRAITNARCCGSNDPQMTAERLSELQERMDVAQTQLLLYQELKNENHTRDGGIALRDLESGLFDLTDLYNKFAVKFNLWKSALAIINCSIHPDPHTIVRKIWQNIVDEIENPVHVPDHNNLGTSLTGEQPPDLLISEKVKEIGGLFYPSEKVFSIAFLCGFLEERLYRHNAAPELLIDSLLSVGVSPSLLFETYSSLYEQSVTSSPPEKINYFAEALVHMLRIWEHRAITPFERSELVTESVKVQINKILELYTTDPDLQTNGLLIEKLETLKLALSSSSSFVSNGNPSSLPLPTSTPTQVRTAWQ